jgi:hypothetical protein
VVAPPLPWWKRLFRRKKKVLEAGQRPGRGGDRGRTHASAPSAAGRIVKLLLALIVLAGAVGVIGPYRQKVTNEVQTLRRRFLPHFNPVRPSEESASSFLPAHPPKDAFDLDPATFWATGPVANGVGAVLTVTFQAPVDLGKIIFTSGNSADFAGQPRPKKLHLSYSGGGTDLALADTPNPQTVSLNAPKVTSAQIAIQEVWQSATGHSCSIAEIEFFAKS